MRSTDESTPSEGEAATQRLARFEVRNPANGTLVESLPAMHPGEVAALASRLREAQPAWEALGPERRKRHLLDWLNWIVDNKDRILRMVHEEAGKSWGDSQIELLVAVEVINYCTKHAEEFLADESHAPHNLSAITKKLRVLRRPYPLVGIITPWNYPLAMPMMDVPGALMAGAAVLTKPSEETPLAWTEVVRGWNEEIGAPPVLGVANGLGETGQAVVDQVDMVQFTGSTATGRRIAVRGAERLIPVSLELGGKDPMIVLSDADLDRAVHGAVWGGLFNAGQSCVAVERIYVEAPVYDEFVARLVRAADQIRVGHDAADKFRADYGALANESQLAIVEKQVADALDKGARVLTGGNTVSDGLFYPPTVLVGVDHSMQVMTEETFGPLLPVMRVANEEEAIRLANDSVYGLSASVWTRSKERAERVGRRLEAGGVNINNAMTHVFQFPLPMGGWKASGLGNRFGGPNGIRKYCRQQAFVSERVNVKRELHWYPNTLAKAVVTDKALRLLGMHDWRRRLGRPVAGQSTSNGVTTRPRENTTTNRPEENTMNITTAGRPLDASTVAEAFQRTVATHPDKPALRTIDGSLDLSWRDLDSRVRSLAAGLAAAGLGHGDTLALMLPNTPECHMLDFAATHLGAVPFAIFNSSPAEQIAHQLDNADARIVITQQDFLPKVLDAVNSLGGQVAKVVVVDGDATAETVTLAEVEAAGDPSFDFDAAWQAVTAGDLVTLIYTSGTTGPPKGAQWTHNTVMAEQRALDAVLPMPELGIISFLPMAHAGGRITSQYMSLANGATITTCPDMKEVPVALGVARPDAFFAVPRLWEKLQVAIEGIIASMPDEQASALREVLEVGHARVKAEETGSGVSAADVEALVAKHEALLERIKPILGKLGLDRIEAAFVGGAPSSPELSQFFRAAGVPMLEAYGLTEGSLNVFNRVTDFKTGTAGKPLPGVELKLLEDGELLARSELNFAGYRKQPEATADALDADGWLHTGDIARIDDDGFVTIVDRKKEIIITSAGKNMSPANIESTVRGESSLIGQVVAIGDGRKYVTALITLDPEAAPVHAKQLGLEELPLDELVQHPTLLAEIEGTVAAANKRLHGNEQIKKYAVLGSAWLPDSDELTPTAKLKRRVIHAKYADDIDRLYVD